MAKEGRFDKLDLKGKGTVERMKLKYPDSTAEVTKINIDQETVIKTLEDMWLKMPKQ